MHAASLHIEYPMLFEIANLREGRVSHCGVMEFVAEEGHVYLPYWVRAACCLVLPFHTHSSTCVHADDAEPAAAGGRHCEAQERLASEGHLRQAEAAEQRLFGHHQPQGCVRAHLHGFERRISF